MRLRVAVAATVLLAVACGGADAEVIAPPKVDPALAPATLAADLKLYENVDRETVEAFADAGETAVVADGRVWEIRRADRLLGTLQISTVMPRVDLISERTRDQLVSEIMPGERARVRIEGVEVHSSIVEDRAFFLWFGANLFEVIQMKDRRVDFEALVTEVIAHQRTIPAWKPLVEVLDPEEDR